MREGPLAELFRATEAAQRQAEQAGAPAPPAEETPAPPAKEPEERTVEHVPSWEESTESAVPAPPPPAPAPPPPVQAYEPPVTRYIEPMPEQPARLHRAPRPDSSQYLAVIRVVGVGGAGLNAVNRMIDAGISEVEFVAVNTDIQALQGSDAPLKIHIGSVLTKGLGSGSDPEIGRLAAEEGYDQLRQALRGSDMVFVAA
ncbi:MAG TPA: hypothetical protein VM690_03305, partial [Gaiellaceae bacterium]|nr:hypothetical protein [Gaiellaceae bacterium]